MRRSRILVLLASLTLLAGGAFVAGCGDDDDDDGGDTTAAAGEDLGLIQEGQLLVGTDTPFPPFEIGKPPDITGYDIEVVNAVAENLGLTVTYQDTSFDTIFRDTAQGKFDMAVAASTITPEREQTVDFSDPYYQANQSLVVAADDTEITTVDDLSGKTVGAQDGTTGEEYANDETPAAQVRGFPEGPDAINALRAGQVDAVIIDQPVAVDATESQAGGDIKIAQEIVTSELYGIPFAPDNDALREAVNGALQTLKDDGTIADLYQQYFPGTEVPAEVLEGTTTVAG
jgi:polar amino acid transport system substrate-binding protein